MGDLAAACAYSKLVVADFSTWQDPTAVPSHLMYVWNPVDAKFDETMRESIGAYKFCNPVTGETRDCIDPLADKVDNYVTVCGWRRLVACIAAVLAVGAHCKWPADELCSRLRSFSG